MCYRRGYSCSARGVQSKSVAQLVMVPGIVTAASKPKHVATSVTAMCRDCRLETTFTASPGGGGLALPRVCSQGAAAAGGAKCSLDPWVVLPGKSSFADQQSLKLQERPEDVPTGELPRSLALTCERALVGTASPGTRVTLVGVYSIHAAKEEKKGREAVAIRQPFLRCAPRACGLHACLASRRAGT